MALNIDYLNEYLNGSFAEKGHPQWFKLWSDKFAIALDLDNLDDLSPTEQEVLFLEVGKAFINALFYSQDRNKAHPVLKIDTRDGRVLWNALKRDVDQSYNDLAKHRMNGSLGGRPRKKTDDQ